MNLKKIEELIVQFQQSGGVFENAEVRYYEDSGYGCHSLNNKKNTIISCPASLLVDVNDIDINENGLFISKPDKYGERIDFLNNYFRFHFNKNVVLQQNERKYEIGCLSDKERSLISDIYPPDLLELKKYNSLEYEKKRIIDSHNIGHLEKKVIMPFVSFVNYNKNGCSFNISDDKISISGKFNGEILAKYNDDDALKIASGYNFITDTKYIYSIPLAYQMMNGKKLVINRDTHEGLQLGNGRWKPGIKIQRNSITLGWFPLYMEGSAVYPATIAKIIADEIKIPAENLLYNVIRLNLHALVPAAFQLQKSKNGVAKFLGAAAQRQLEIIAGSR